MPQTDFPLSFANVPANWNGSVQDLVNLLAALGVAKIPSGYALVWTGPVDPASNQGVGFNTTSNEWKYWDETTGSYKSQSTSADIGQYRAFAVLAAMDTTRYVQCDGRAVPRAAPYDKLFAVLGVVFGSGDGSTTFNVPNASGRCIIAVGAASGSSPHAVGDLVGFDSHVIDRAELPKLLGSDYNSGATSSEPEIVVTTKVNSGGGHQGNPNGINNAFGNGIPTQSPAITGVIGIRYA